MKISPTLIGNGLCVWLFAHAACAAEESDRPNIVFLFADDQRADTIGFHGNLSTDPHELTNLAADPNHRAELGEMKALMETWRKRLGDPHPLSVAEPEDRTPVHDNATRVLDVWQPQWIRGKYFDGRENPTHGKSKKSHPK